MGWPQSAVYASINTAIFEHEAAWILGLLSKCCHRLSRFGGDAHWLGGQIAATLVLHTWGQTLTQHLHVHALVAAGAVHFRYKDYTHGNRRRALRLEPVEFLRRFALHVLPRGFNRIRHYGLIANRNKHDLLALARSALDAPHCTPEQTVAEPVSVFWQRVIAIDIARCPHCKRGTLRVVAAISPQPRPPP